MHSILTLQGWTVLHWRSCRHWSVLWGTTGRETPLEPSVWHVQSAAPPKSLARQQRRTAAVSMRALGWCPMLPSPSWPCTWSVVRIKHYSRLVACHMQLASSCHMRHVHLSVVDLILCLCSSSSNSSSSSGSSSSYCPCVPLPTSPLPPPGCFVPQCALLDMA
jgi:hypothetical protein